MVVNLVSPAVELKEVTKHYGKVQALKGINLRVEPGEVVAFLGPNGAGKSTAISLMLGLRPPTTGSVTLFGENPRYATNRKRIGAMLQESGVPSTLKVRELVEMFARFHDNPVSTRAIIAMAELDGKANVQIGRLSGGQKQRVYFALALVGNPDIIFLDEPTTGLDIESRRNFWQQIGAQVERKKTVILTTHNLEEADALAKRIVVIDQGSIIAEGTPAEIKRHVGGKHVRFQATEVSEETLARLPEVQSVQRLNERFDIYTLRPEVVLKALFSDGVEMEDLDVVGAGLEEAFIALTSRKEVKTDI